MIDLNKIKKAIYVLTGLSVVEDVTDTRFALKLGSFKPLEIGYDKRRNILTEESMRFSCHLAMLRELSLFMINDESMFTAWLCHESNAATKLSSWFKPPILPEPNRFVLIRTNRYNWKHEDPNVRCVVARLITGISLEEREALPESDIRKRTYTAADQHGNNKVPFRWDTFGASQFFGQDVEEWTYIPE